MITTEKTYQFFSQTGSVTINTKDISPENPCIFFGLKGANTDGSVFAKEAIEKGAKYAIVGERSFENLNKNIFYYPDALMLLQNIARMHRNHLSIPIIGITGSNGKTTTKELIFSVLQKKFNTFCTPGNLNNHIGVPLSILKIKEDHEIAVIEMGANHQKEISFLCDIAHPDYGLITNIGKAHLEGFGGIEGVIKGKSELYQYISKKKGIVFVNINNSLLMELSNKIKQITYGNSKEAHYSFQIVQSEPDVMLHFFGEKNNEVLIKSNLSGVYNAENIMAAVCIGQYFNISDENLRESIESYHASNNRSQIKETIKKNIVFMDAYNANPTSMRASIDSFIKHKHEVQNLIFILGDMLELGNSSDEEHLKIIELLKNFSSKQLFFIGNTFKKVVSPLAGNAFNNVDELISFIKKNPISHKSILVKGSRGIHLEKIYPYL